MSNNSLRYYDDIAGRAHLQLAETHASGIVIVEGESDRDALASIVSRRCLLVAGNRRSVFDTATSLLDIGNSRIICVFDPDFVSDPAELEDKSVLFPYPTADLESFILELGAAEIAIKSAVPRGQLDKVGGVAQVVWHIKANLRGVSTIRLLNAVYDWGLSFNASLSSFVSVNGDVDLEKYLRMLLAKRAPNKAHPILEIDSVQARVAECEAPDRYRGRDFLQLYSGLLSRGYLKAKHGLSLSAASLEYALEVAAPAMLANSDWGRALQEKWERL
ncbi:hypothetical protein ACFU1Q_15510 [Brachybacterium paraconglomeratum]